MATIQIRDLPDETLAKWKVRAAKRGQSLQQYMKAYLTEEARKLTHEEMIERLESRSGGNVTLKEAAAWVRDDRDSH